MIVAISPHLDDAVLSCGALLAAHPGSVVITAMAGKPSSWDTLTPWDAACGFEPGVDVIAARRAEDREALSHLGATPVWLDFKDAQYGPSPPVHELRRALRAALAPFAPRAVLSPLGLFHSDHVLVSEAVLGLLPGHPGVELLAYEDAIYRLVPGETEAALARARRHGLTVHPREPRHDHLERKGAAVLSYRSQLRGLSTPTRLGYEDALAPERTWKITT